MPGIRVSARAVDLLGRQQIAGIPTALHELFKNAHDAYADSIEVDFYRQHSAILIRDDGIGMTKDEFETRWLTLGTESKLRSDSGLALPYRDKSKPERAILGEKGIGRLAIAAIGRQVFVLTKAKRDKENNNIVGAFINWGLFEIPGIRLDQIEIPVHEWDSSGLPDKAFVSNFIETVKENVRSLESSIPDSSLQELYSELDSFKFDPSLLYPRINGLSLEETGGTHFFISPVDSILESDIDGGGEDGFAPPLKKNLIGFCNSMIPGSPQPPITVSFRDHRSDGSVHDLIDPDVEFFTEGDYKSADHHFYGTFDEWGQFSGKIQIYGGPEMPYILPWPNARGKKTNCGPFEFKMAYVQGLQSESRLPPEIYGPLTKKLDQLGGLYLYNDGVRVLPYGNSDYDWVGIERRRTKAAKDYFFSYRRVFGAVLISRDKNSNLVEKAGREGFMENKAYRQMQEMISSFLIEVAREHFRKGSSNSEDFWRVKNELQHQHELLKKRETRTRTRKNNFSEGLSDFFGRIETDEPASKARVIQEEFENRISSIEKLSLSDPDDASQELLAVESDAKKKLRDLRSTYSITRPRGIGLSKNLTKDWNAYLELSEEIENKHFSPLEEKLRDSITNAMSAVSDSVDKRRRIDIALEEIRKRTESRIQKVSKETNTQKADLNDCVVAEIREHITTFQETLKQTLIEYEKTDISEFSHADLSIFQKRLETQLTQTAENETKALEGLRDQLIMLSDAIRYDESIADVTVALEERAEKYRDQVDQYASMAQIGTAVGIIQHEFSSTISLMRHQIRQLRGWADTNPQLKEIYQNIRTNFEHIDEYMNVFKPFDRRLQRRRVPIPGQEIRYYLMRLFEDRIARHEIKLKGTRAFDNATIKAFPSTVYPCFVNLIDNCIYWLTREADGRPRIAKGVKEIYLNATEKGLTVSNNGPAIERRIADRIFDFGFSKKDSGQGMGLYIAREILRRDGMDLVLEEALGSKRVSFQIVTSEIELGE